MAKVKVNKGSCIGCGMCTGICPEVFELGDDSLSENKFGEGAAIPAEFVDAAKEAADSCPTQAIEVEE